MKLVDWNAESCTFIITANKGVLEATITSKEEWFEKKNSEQRLYKKSVRDYQIELQN